MSSLGDLLRRFWGAPGAKSAHPAPSNVRQPAIRPSDQTVVAARPTPTEGTVRSTQRSPQVRPVATAHATRRSTPPVAASAAPNNHTNAVETTMIASSRGEAQDYLARVQGKINKLAEEFASGAINRDQFQQLFDHYQRERNAIQNWMNTAALSDDWKDISNEGKSIVIRSMHTAKVLGYAIYENDSGMPLNTIGDFEIDPALAVPMLSSYRTATKEIFGGDMRSTQIEGGKWLCFVPGASTTMLALFNTEPAARQLEIMEDLHRLFEQANRRHLAHIPIDIEQLAFPHNSFLGRLQ
jgi:hypothetical protein